jgi:hypothetical protein
MLLLQLKKKKRDQVFSGLYSTCLYVFFTQYREDERPFVLYPLVICLLYHYIKGEAMCTLTSVFLSIQLFCIEKRSGLWPLNILPQAEKMPLNICLLYIEKIERPCLLWPLYIYISVPSISPSTAEERLWSSGLCAMYMYI